MPILNLNDWVKQEFGYKPGTQIGAAEAKQLMAEHRVYVENEIKKTSSSEFTPTGTEITFPDGTKRKAVKTSPNSAQILGEYTAPAPHHFQAEDGRIGMVYPDAKTVFAWDENSGQPVRGAKKVDPFAALLGGAPQSTPVGQSGAATLEPPISVPTPAPAPVETQAPQQAPAPKVYSISGQEDYAKVPSGAAVSWNGQTFIKR
jgi:hypothetical protein